MNIIEQIEVVKKVVESSFEQNSQYTWLTFLNEDEKSHIIQIGASILCTKWNVGYPGGGFVQAVVDNDLMKSIGSADGTSLKGLKFFAQLMYNEGMPIALQNKHIND